MRLIPHLLLYSTVIALTLIIPKNHLNHRLSYSDGPMIINSALNQEERAKDLFNLPEEFTYLANDGNGICSENGVDLVTCPKMGNQIMWKIAYAAREVRFKSANGDCLTVDAYNTMNDSYRLILKECSLMDSDQLFIMQNDHEQDSITDILQENRGFISNANKKSFVTEGFKYLMNIE